KESPFMPDPYHIHQFIFIYLANKNNPMTTLIILPFILINNLIALQFYNNHIALVILAFTYVSIYTIVYLVLYKKHQKTILDGTHSMTKKGGLIDKNPSSAEAEHWALRCVIDIVQIIFYKIMLHLIKIYSRPKSFNFKIKK